MVFDRLSIEQLIGIDMKLNPINVLKLEYFFDHYLIVWLLRSLVLFNEVGSEFVGNVRGNYHSNDDIDDHMNLQLTTVLNLIHSFSYNPLPFPPYLPLSLPFLTSIPSCFYDSKTEALEGRVALECAVHPRPVAWRPKPNID